MGLKQIFLLHCNRGPQLNQRKPGAYRDRQNGETNGWNNRPWRGACAGISYRQAPKSVYPSNLKAAEMQTKYVSRDEQLCRSWRILQGGLHTQYAICYHFKSDLLNNTVTYTEELAANLVELWCERAFEVINLNRRVKPKVFWRKSKSKRLKKTNDLLEQESLTRFDEKQEQEQNRNKKRGVRADDQSGRTTKRTNPTNHKNGGKVQPELENKAPTQKNLRAGKRQKRENQRLIKLPIKTTRQS